MGLTACIGSANANRLRTYLMLMVRMAEEYLEAVLGGPLDSCAERCTCRSQRQLNL